MLQTLSDEVHFLRVPEGASNPAIPCYLAGIEINASSFDSLSAVELSNSISSSLGLKLPGTLIFDYPSLALIAQHVHGQLSQTAGPTAELHHVPASTAITTSAPTEGLTVQASTPRSYQMAVACLILMSRQSIMHAASGS